MERNFSLIKDDIECRFHGVSSDQRTEEREFEGWIQGSPEDYVMSLLRGEYICHPGGKN